MNRFTTRVVLHGAKQERYYDELHAAMEKQGFTRTIEAEGGTYYKLPDAEYNFIGAVNKEDVLAKVKAAANTVSIVTNDDDFSVLVTEAVVRKWHNLTKA